MPTGLRRRELVELGIGAVAVVAAAVAHFAGLTPVLAFAVAAGAIAVLARLVGSATEQLGARLGSGPAAAIQSALGNLPELFIALFALSAGLDEVVKAALAQHFARGVPPIAHWNGIATRDGELGPPLLEGAVGWLECRIWADYDAGDHTLFVGEVLHAERDESKRPLVYIEGSYRPL